MKQLKKTVALLSLTFILGLSSPVFAQQVDNPNTTKTVNTDDNDGDTGKWGLLGLLGLAGLFFMKRKENATDRPRVSTNR